MLFRLRKSILLPVLDWVLVGGTAIVGFAFGKLNPNLRPFSIDDSTISYPFQEKPKIPTRFLGIISTLIPGVLIALTIFLVPKPGSETLKRRIWRLHTAWLGLGISLAAVMLITDGMKNLVGKPRPDLISRCAPDPERIASGNYTIANGLFGAAVCTSWTGISDSGITKDELLDGFRSWVSGHSGLSFAGMTYLTIFLCTHLLNLQGTDAFRSTTSFYTSRNTAHSYTPLLLLLAVPMLLAGYVATTRYSDYRHHGIDIVLGSLLGVGTAALGWTWSGSRSVNRVREPGCFSKPVGEASCDDDPEAGKTQQQQIYDEIESGQAPPSSDRGDGFLGEAGEARGQQGVEAAGDPEGALQLREVSLSFSSLDASTKKKSTEIPSNSRTEGIREGIDVVNGNPRARALTQEEV